jgi:hypothetical protein
MTTAVAVPKEARPVSREWLQLAAATAAPAAFDPEMTAGLPPAARAWLAHAIEPGTRLRRTVELTMHGQIRLGRWRGFTARQILAPPDGYIWAATARVAGVPVSGFDRLSSGTGEMSWRLLRLFPVMTAAGPDITRSAAGRMAGEIALLPTAFQTASWEQGERAGTARASWQFGDDTETAELRVSDDGTLLEVRMNRWGNPGSAPFARHPFGVSVEAESAFSGVTIPSRFRAGWWWGTSRQDAGEFFRAEITQAIFR